ncbi:MAG: hypothetical protein ACXVJO_15770 [Thermoanaerobaculia bacterium]
MRDSPHGRRTPDALTNIAIAIGALLLVVATVVRLWMRGGPFFDAPQTIVEHVERADREVGNPLRAPLLVIPRLARFLPRGATVTSFRPLNGRAHDDSASFLTAIGQLPRNRVLPPFSAGLETPRTELVEYVIAIDGPFTHPAYRQIAEVPRGRLYKVER